MNADSADRFAIAILVRIESQHKSRNSIRADSLANPANGRVVAPWDGSARTMVKPSAGVLVAAICTVNDTEKFAVEISVGQ